MARKLATAVLAEMSISEDCYAEADLTLDDRYLLIEENVRGSNPPYWATSWKSRGAASDYHLNQECVEDWSIFVLIDLYTGDKFSAHTVRQVDWTKQEPA